MSRPVFYLFAGPNGAGKSTLHGAVVQERLIPADAPFVNADQYEATHLSHVADALERSRLAREWASAQRTQCLAQGASFASETVFSHTSKLDLMAAAKRAGFAVVLLVVCVDDPAQLLERVVSRIEEGGHSVPPERILGRYPRTIRHLGVAVRRADLALLYDTSASKPGLVVPHRLVARCSAGEVRWQADVLPAWAHSVLFPVPMR